MITTEPAESKKTRMEDVVRNLRSKYVAMFLDSSSGFPRFNHRFTLEEQLKTERELEKFIDENTRRVEKCKESTTARTAELEKLKASVKVFVARFLSSGSNGIETDFLDEFSRVGDEFVREARAFDREISLEDIHQALRNVWIINSFQVLLGKLVALTPSGFAYSLLYPYTDNFLDDPSISMEGKKEFVDALGRRLSGESVPSLIYTLSIPFDLIKMIERQYPRSRYPEVYLSLLAIHNAQVEALAQQARLSSDNIDEQGRESSLSEMDILEMSVEKGGTSVLADAYVAAGTIEDGMKDFAFGFGVCLQLIDDLQDLKEDLRHGHETVMTKAASAAPLDGLTNRLIDFTESVIKAENPFDSLQARSLLELSERSCVQLILEAVARAMDTYSSDYVRTLEAFSPLRFAYLKSLKENLKRRWGALSKLQVGQIHSFGEFDSPHALPSVSKFSPPLQ